MLYNLIVSEYEVQIGKKALKGIAKLGKKEKEMLAKLITDLRKSGPSQSAYPHFSALGSNRYHCHLSYRWVACWYNEKGNIKIEVYYVGSRESAPY